MTGSPTDRRTDSRRSSYNQSFWRSRLPVFCPGRSTHWTDRKHREVVEQAAPSSRLPAVHYSGSTNDWALIDGAAFHISQAKRISASKS
jgi:hypothetical protein